MLRKVIAVVVIVGLAVVGILAYQAANQGFSIYLTAPNWSSPVAATATTDSGTLNIVPHEKFKESSFSTERIGLVIYSKGLVVIVFNESYRMERMFFVAGPEWRQLTQSLIEEGAKVLPKPRR